MKTAERLGAAAAPAEGLPRRDFLKVGAGFSLALVLAGALPGCSPGAKVPVAGWQFLQPGDVELFTALAPAVALELGGLDAAKRKKVTEATVRNIDATCAALDLGSRAELRKLLDLLAIGPLRYVLAGVGAWNEAGIEQMQAFLSRWRSSRFATLNAGGNVLVRLTASSFYLLPESWPSTGYPGPLEFMFNAINS
ncbi:MAG: hypothetical protein MUF16_05620 [Burkholderiaceae bacterium]|nr:hypothetical protein [Burkholderiaceae bacterium]